MLTAGIVAEYNPFHNGHLYHIQKTKELSGANRIIVVMSGNFTQRAEPAIMSKWARAKAALSCGADLVVELPLPYATASAEFFAKGAVSILDALGIVDIISFGSEIGDMEKLKKISCLLMKTEFSPILKTELKKGVSFAKARNNAILSVDENFDDIIGSPNNILAIEYIKALKKLNSKIEPFTVCRKGVNYHDLKMNENFASATYCRKLIEDTSPLLKEALPSVSYRILMDEINEERAPVNLSSMEKTILAKLRQLSEDDFKIIFDVGEGLEKRIFSAVKKSSSYDELCSMIKTKRYAMSRVRRIILRAFLNIDYQHILNPVPYIRVLGFNDTGHKILASVRKTCALPVITKPSSIKNHNLDVREIFNIESKSTDLWSVFCPKIQKCGLDFTQNPIYNGIKYISKGDRQ